MVAAFLCAAVAACGCAKTQGQVAAPEPPAIPVAHPATHEVTDFVDFTGQTAAVQTVTIVPRVTGYLEKEPFKEGAEVKAGDVLFEIDPRPYKAQLDQAQGQVILNQARLKEAQADNARAKALAKTPGAISQQDLDRYQAAEEEAEASLEASKASLEVYKLNLSFCQVKSPIDGQVSRYFMTPGNLVNQDQTQLTTIVSLDPMYVYFNMDEVTLLRIRRAIDEGKIKPYQSGQFPVYIGLQGEDGFPHEGRVDFFNNQVDSTTGSITVRGVLQNPPPKVGHRLFSPGMFVRVHLPIGQPHSALLVIDRAIGSDQGLKYVYTMDPKTHVIQQKTVDTGPLEDDGLRVIEPEPKGKGLTADDWVVVGGIQQVHPKTEIRPDFVQMPTLGPSTATDSGAAGGAATSGTATSGTATSGTANSPSNAPASSGTSTGAIKTQQNAETPSPPAEKAPATPPSATPPPAH
ncbi:MAG TPA: efflux RND transporter periplasmic adaptor subunit [Pirellulales bacterium]|nr:efflux RND transporter periplasmic adaptor subunit [Pirellulales bacterium]